MEHSFSPHSHGFNPLVGTASWSDKTPKDRLRFYASPLHLVELHTLATHD